jgi:asparagine synthase (glutamine-hydrolysing)
MFAFALWDRERNELALVRDRLGIKPLYYAHRGAEFAFASELDTLRRLPWFDDEIDGAALAAYFRYLAVPGSAAILRGAAKLGPGRILTVRGGELDERAYWRLDEVVRRGAERPFEGDFREAADALEALLKDAVGACLLSDVPLGAFLSGGIDSSSVVALAQAVAERPIKTYTLGFTVPSHDESAHARAIAEHLGAEHHEEIMTPGQVLDLLPQVTALYDEPFADASSLPTHLLCHWARSDIIVALSGDGGDELFGGYPRYGWASRIARLRHALTPGGAGLLGRALGALPAALWDGPVNRLSGGRFAGSDGLSKRVGRLAAYLDSDPERIYHDVIPAWDRPPGRPDDDGAAALAPDLAAYPELDPALRMMAIDQGFSLVDLYLTKVDRASMAVSLEVRVPLLDHRVAEFSWRLPKACKVAETGDIGKPLLREVLGRYVPPALTQRPKTGFGLPLAGWLRNELRPWAEDILSVDSLKRDGLLKPEPVRAAWRAHLEGEDRLHQVWTVLMFLEWRRRRRP